MFICLAWIDSDLIVPAVVLLQFFISYSNASYGIHVAVQDDSVARPKKLCRFLSTNNK